MSHFYFTILQLRSKNIRRKIMRKKGRREKVMCLLATSFSHFSLVELFWFTVYGFTAFQSNLIFNSTIYFQSLPSVRFCSDIGLIFNSIFLSSVTSLSYLGLNDKKKNFKNNKINNT